MSIKGLGPHGERASPPERVTLLPEDIKIARDLELSVCIVMHTMQTVSYTHLTLPTNKAV